VSRWPITRHWPDDYTDEEQARLRQQAEALRARRRPRVRRIELGGVAWFWEVADADP
jgi:hypothetical protein